MKTLDYLERVKRRHHIESDYGVAKLMGIDRAVVSGWVTGRHTIGLRDCYKVAALLELDPALVIADMEAERAEKAGKTDDAAWWGDVRKKLVRVLAAVAVGAGISGPGQSDARQTVAEGDGLYIGAHRRKRRGDNDQAPRIAQPWCPA